MHSERFEVDEMLQDLEASGLPALATLKEVAKAARCTYQHVWVCVQQGRCHAFKRGGRWLVRRIDAARWLLGQS